MDKKTEALEIFGKLLMERVRDCSLKTVEMILERQMKSPDDQRLGENLAELTDFQKSCVFELGAIAVTETLANLFDLIGFKNDSIKLLFFLDNQNFDLNEISDGLIGEMQTNEGWIAKYSKYHVHEKSFY